MLYLRPYPGLLFYIFKIEGTVRCTYTCSGKPTRRYEISDADFGDRTLSPVEELSNNALHAGPEVRLMNDLHLRIIKNEGSLDIEFEAKNGYIGKWVFGGLQELKGARRLEMVGTKTNMPAWTATPRHIYMEGYNGHRGMEEGLLHIDTKLATVTFEPWVGKQLSESVILDECDLSKQDITVRYERCQLYLSRSVSHTLELKEVNGKSIICVYRCEWDSHKIWGTDGDDPFSNRKYVDPELITAAISHCIKQTATANPGA